MKVVVDLQLCEGNARCVEAAPEVFEVGDDDKARLLTGSPAESLRDKLKLAVRMCPRQAIALKED
ncbi:MAG: ferredoxin [Deltaproteobacteria bacterium]|nr:ferredoxin [Deltaproteobacteria bacterium]